MSLKCLKLLYIYRVANVVSGALDKAAAKKVIIEASFPGSGELRELLLEGLQVMIIILIQS